MQTQNSKPGAIAGRRFALTVLLLAIHFFGATVVRAENQGGSSSWEANVINGTAQFVAERMQSEFVLWFLTDVGTQICDLDGSAHRYYPYFQNFCTYFRTYKNEPVASIGALQAALRQDFQNLPAQLIAIADSGASWGGPLMALFQNVSSGATATAAFTTMYETEGKDRSKDNKFNGPLTKDCEQKHEAACALWIAAAIGKARIDAANVKATDLNGLWANCSSDRRPLDVTDHDIIVLGTLCENYEKDATGKLKTLLQFNDKTKIKSIISRYQIFAAHIDKMEVNIQTLSKLTSDNAARLGAALKVATSIIDLMQDACQLPDSLPTCAATGTSALGTQLSDLKDIVDSANDAVKATSTPAQAPNPRASVISNSLLYLEKYSSIPGLKSNSQAQQAMQKFMHNIMTGSQTTTAALNEIYDKNRSQLKSECESDSYAACALWITAAVGHAHETMTRANSYFNPPLPDYGCPSSSKNATPIPLSSLIDYQLRAFMVALCETRADAPDALWDIYPETKDVSHSSRAVRALNTVIADAEHLRAVLVALVAPINNAQLRNSTALDLVVGLADFLQDACALSVSTACAQGGYLPQRLYDIEMLAAHASAGAYDQGMIWYARYLQDSHLMAQDAQFTRYVTFFSNLGSANSSADVKNALDSAASPAGAWKLKRLGQPYFSIGALGGASLGEEDIKTRNRLPDAVQATHIPVAAVFAPVGLDFSFPSGDHSTWGFFVSAVDLGDLVATNLNGNQGGTTAKPSSQPTIDQVTAPGVFLRFGLGNSPFVLGAGAEYFAHNLEIQQNGNVIGRSDVLRYMLFLAIDIVIFPL